MDGEYVGRLAADDPLHDFLVTIFREQLRFGDHAARFRVFASLERMRSMARREVTSSASSRSPSRIRDEAISCGEPRRPPGILLEHLHRTRSLKFRRSRP